MPENRIHIQPSVCARYIVCQIGAGFPQVLTLDEAYAVTALYRLSADEAEASNRLGQAHTDTDMANRLTTALADAESFKNVPYAERLTGRKPQGK